MADRSTSSSPYADAGTASSGGAARSILSSSACTSTLWQPSAFLLSICYPTKGLASSARRSSLSLTSWSPVRHPCGFSPGLDSLLRTDAPSHHMPRRLPLCAQHRATWASQWPSCYPKRVHPARLEWRSASISLRAALARRSDLSCVDWATHSPCTGSKPPFLSSSLSVCLASLQE